MHKLRFDGRPVNPEWRTIYIVTKPPVQLTSPDALLATLRINCDPEPPFRFPNWLLSKLGTAGFDILHNSASMLSLSYRDGLQRVAFLHPVMNEEFYIDLGVCRTSDSSVVHWARVIISHPNQQISIKLRNVSAPHDCTEDHIDAWPVGARVFGDGQRSVRLSLVPDNRSQATTLVVHVELHGPVYENLNLLRAANIVFPPLSEIYVYNGSPSDSDVHVASLPLVPRDQSQACTATIAP